MISRVTAEFESPELAEMALKRIKESIDYVYSANIMYNKISDKAERLKHGTNYTVIPTFNSNHTNFLTAVLESPASENAIPEPARNRKTSACIICGSAAIDNVTSLLNAMGGLNIRSAQ